MVTKIQVPDIAGTIQRAGQGFRDQRNLNRERQDKIASDEVDAAKLEGVEARTRHGNLRKELLTGFEKLAAMRANAPDAQSAQETTKVFSQHLATVAAKVDSMAQGIGEEPDEMMQGLIAASQSPHGGTLGANSGRLAALTANAQTAGTDFGSIGTGAGVQRNALVGATDQEGEGVAASNQAAAQEVANRANNLAGITGENISDQNAAELRADQGNNIAGLEFAKRTAMGELLVNFAGDVSPEKAKDIMDEAVGLTPENYNTTAINIALGTAGVLDKVQKGEPLTQEELDNVAETMKKLRSPSQDLMAGLLALGGGPGDPPDNSTLSTAETEELKRLLAESNR
jgi:hypothetical protein